MFHDAGMHVSVHSIGDQGIDWTVDSYDQAMKENPKRGLRHGIIHANIPTDHAIEVMARLQRDADAGYPEPSATFNWWLGDTYAGNFGDQRALRLNPFATYRKHGMIWANGSDYSVTPYPARYGIWAAVARETLLGPQTPDQHLGPHDNADLRAIEDDQAHLCTVGDAEPLRAGRDGAAHNDVRRLRLRARAAPDHEDRRQDQRDRSSAGHACSSARMRSITSA